MSDLDERMKRADRVPVTDLWPDIETREPKPALREPRVRRAIAIVAALAVAAAAIGFATWAFHGSRPRPAAGQCTAPFQVIPHPGSRFDSLNGVTALAPDDVWAVGHGGQPGGRGPFGLGIPDSRILHWDGAAWHTVRTPVVRGALTPGRTGNLSQTGRLGDLRAISAVAPDDVWAVGLAGGALIEHWDGRRWTVVQTPFTGRPGSGLIGVDAVSRRDVWAVGSSGSEALIGHWDGSRWRVVQSADREAELYAVAASGPKDVWAVGETREQKALVEHWDGSRWKIEQIPSPVPSGAGSVLYAVAADSRNDAWVVGNWISPGTGNGDVVGRIVEHWDGAHWHVIGGVPRGNLLSVAANGPNDIWVVGSRTQHVPRGPHTHVVLALVGHWDGKRWTVSRTPRLGRETWLSSVTVLSNDAVFAVGTSSPVGRAFRGGSLIEEGCTPPGTS